MHSQRKRMGEGKRKKAWKLCRSEKKKKRGEGGRNLSEIRNSVGGLAIVSSGQKREKSGFSLQGRKGGRKKVREGLTNWGEGRRGKKLEEIWLIPINHGNDNGKPIPWKKGGQKGEGQNLFRG